MPTHLQPGRDSLVERTWQTAVRPEFVGLLFLVAGAVSLVVAFTTGGTAADPVGWIDAVRIDFAIPTTAGLLGGAVILLVGAAWDRWRRSEVDSESGASEWRNRRLPLAGGLIGGLGVVFVLVGWFALLSAGPGGELTLTTGETAESFQGRVAGENVAIMLPYRFQLEGAELEEGASFDVGLAKPGNDPFRRATLGPGRSIAVGEYRVAPVGLSTESGQLQAVFTKSEGEGTAVATLGESFRLGPDGPEFKVDAIEENYLDTMGPAARLSSGEMSGVWAFQRTPKPEHLPEGRPDVQLERIEKAPAVVFRVSPAVPMWPVFVGGGLLVVGFAISLIAPERVRLLEHGEYRVDSFNEAGRFAVDDAENGRET